MPPADPTPKPSQPHAVTPADIFTPHGQVNPKPTEGVEPDVEPGIIDPRRLGPPILDPPPPGLPPPEPAATDKPGDQE